MWLTDFLQSNEIAVKPENILISASFSLLSNEF